MAKPASRHPDTHSERDPWPKKRTQPEPSGRTRAERAPAERDPSEREPSELDPPGASGLPAGTGPETGVDYTTSTTSGRRSAGDGTGPGLSSGRGNKI